MDRIGKIIGLLFMSRNMAHKAHLCVKGNGAYAAHMALVGFYEELPDLADELCEAYMGKYGICEVEDMDEKGDICEPLDMIKTHLKMYQNLAKSIDDRYLQNISDTIEAHYYTTIYKLENLK